MHLILINLVIIINNKMEIFSEQVKAEHKRTQFPIDCQNAFDAGKRMVMQVQK